MKFYEKNKKKGMSEMEKSAKMDVLKDLRKMAAEAMGENIKGGMKKVTVASDSKEGLEHGLEKAKDILEQKEMDEGDTPCPECGDEGCEACAEGEAFAGPKEEMDEDDIDRKIQELMELKKKKQGY